MADRRLVPSERTILEQITDSGAPALLLERYAGRLEYHEPWHIDRQVSHLFRGMVDPAEVEAPSRARASTACGWSTTAPHRRSPTLPGSPGCTPTT